MYKLHSRNALTKKQYIWQVRQGFMNAPTEVVKIIWTCFKKVSIVYQNTPSHFMQYCLSSNALYIWKITAAQLNLKILLQWYWFTAALFSCAVWFCNLMVTAEIVFIFDIFLNCSSLRSKKE